MSKCTSEQVMTANYAGELLTCGRRAIRKQASADARGNVGSDCSAQNAGMQLRRVLEAELQEDVFHAAARAVLRLVACDPLAPRVRSEADEGGIALVPLDDPLLEVATTLLPHIHGGVRLEQLEQPIIADPVRRREVLRVSGREVTHDELVKLLLQGAVCTADRRGDVHPHVNVLAGPTRGAASEAAGSTPELLGRPIS